ALPGSAPRPEGADQGGAAGPALLRRRGKLDRGRGALPGEDRAEPSRGYPHARGGGAAAHEDPLGDEDRRGRPLGQRSLPARLALPSPLGQECRRAHRARRAHPPHHGGRAHHGVGAGRAALRNPRSAAAQRPALRSTMSRSSAPLRRASSWLMNPAGSTSGWGSTGPRVFSFWADSVSPLLNGCVVKCTVIGSVGRRASSRMRVTLAMYASTCFELWMAFSPSPPTVKA